MFTRFFYAYKPHNSTTFCVNPNDRFTYSPYVIRRAKRK